MIKLIPDPVTLKVTQIEYENGDFKIKLYPNILSLYDQNDENNVGNIIETYRVSKDTIFYEKKLNVIQKFINDLPNLLGDMTLTELLICYRRMPKEESYY